MVHVIVTYPARDPSRPLVVSHKVSVVAYHVGKSSLTPHAQHAGARAVHRRSTRYLTAVVVVVVTTGRLGS